MQLDSARMAELSKVYEQGKEIPASKRKLVKIEQFGKGKLEEKGFVGSLKLEK